MVFVPTPEGGARRVEIVRGVNAATDPPLARQALEGTLHRHADHDLAVPFVFHDPAARRFVLVVPPGLAHQELMLRAELLTRLAADTSEPIPAYVREARLVIGAPGLRRWLEEPDERAAREDLAAREERVRRRAEDVTRRESDALAREDALTTREDSVAQDELAMRANMAALSAREAKLRVREESAAEPVAPEPPPIEAEPSMSLAPEAMEPSTSHAGDDSMELEPDELTGRLSLARAEPGPDAAEIEPEPDEIAAEEVSPVDESEGPSIEAPLRLSPRSTTPWAAVVDGTVRLWCPGTTETAAVVSGDDVMVRLQVEADGTQPLALLALLRGSAGETIARVVLDLRSPEDRAVIESLGRIFRVRVEVVTIAGRSIASHVLGAPCEPVAQRALEVLGERVASDEELTAESARLLREGVASEVDASAALPDDERDLSTAEGVARALAAYEPLLDGERAARTSLTTGVPVAQIEAAAKRLILAALRVGAALPRAYVERAVKAGVVPDEPTLVVRGMQAYRRSVDAGVATIGRRRADASVAWGPLLDAARRLELPIDATVRAAVAAVWDPDDPTSIAPPDDRTAPSSIAAMDLGERLGWITHPAVRWDVARSLAGSDAPGHIPALRLALHRLPVADCVRLAVALQEQGDALADLWVELLSSPRPALVGLGATVAGLLRLRRALTPLVQHALSPDEGAWRLMGWAAGGFGPALVRAVRSAEGAPVERLSWVLAHAVAQGGAREMERARQGADPTFEQAATRALALQDEVQRWTAALREGRGEGDIERAVAPLLRGTS
ncbi:MAG: hypothetical protein Q8S73_14150 [Deltaproteobacteria bacterium]|nr:hypothetical protein [Myxococcales bacterium]MDP3215244.1 hypothetical protein [Deltaproteobacteria bacterium]